MSKSDKKRCIICGEKAGIFTRIRLNDGMLCGDCVKKCSEHLEDFDEKTADEIRKHLEYRERNKQSHMLSAFKPTITLGEYEILKIDENNKYWMVTTPKRFTEENPDVFYLDQVTECEVVEKKEVFKPVKDDSDKGRTDVIIDKFKRTKPRETEYGFWFYVRIGVHHPCFSEIVMRVNKYIIRERNQSEYVSCKREAQHICDVFTELYQKAKREDKRNN